MSYLAYQQRHTIEEVVSLGSSDPGETSFLRIDQWSFPWYLFSVKPGDVCHIVSVADYRTPAI